MSLSTPSHDARTVDGFRPPSWVVLVVDDEPEVYDVTELVLGESRFCGAALEVHWAPSATEARDFLARRPDTALVLLDVVMESEDAGLALTRYIREELGNRDVQIVVRTGQPGHAPEQDVVLGYDVNGYFLKTEITAQKLRSVVIASLRNFQYVRNLRDASTRDDHVGARSPGPQARSRLRELRGAIERDELALSVQTVIRLDDGTWSGLHLHPTLDASSSEAESPLELVAATDDPELDLLVDVWSLGQAVSLTRRLGERNASCTDVIVPIMTTGPGVASIPAIVDRCLRDHPSARHRLVLELREAVVVIDRSGPDHVVEELRALGVRVALVHSPVCLVSLRSLREIRPTLLKVPATLTEELASGRGEETSAVIQAVIALAHTLGMGVVAEGVSTQRQLEFLRWEGCDYAQGTLIGARQRLDQARRWLEPKTDGSRSH